MKISCVIPAYNSNHISNLLQSITVNTTSPYEIIIVDDASNEEILIEDSSVRIIRNETNQGPSFARNLGAKEAKGDIILFLDSDISIPKNLLEEIDGFFSNNKNYQIWGGRFSSFIPTDNLLTRYKSAYMNYIHQMSTTDTNFVLGACTAVRKESFIEWNADLRYAEDTYWGHEHLYVNNHRIYFDRKNQVDHYKSYSFFSWIKNDFNIAGGMVSSFMSFYRERKTSEFSHVSNSQILSLVSAAMSLFCFLIGLPLISVIAILIWVFFSREMILGIATLGKLNIVSVVLLSFLNSIVHFSGIIFGVLRFLTL